MSGTSRLLFTTSRWLAVSLLSVLTAHTPSGCISPRTPARRQVSTSLFRIHTQLLACHRQPHPPPPSQCSVRPSKTTAVATSEIEIQACVMKRHRQATLSTTFLLFLLTTRPPQAPRPRHILQRSVRPSKTTAAATSEIEIQACVMKRHRQASLSTTFLSILLTTRPPRAPRPHHILHDTRYCTQLT